MKPLSTISLTGCKKFNFAWSKKERDAQKLRGLIKRMEEFHRLKGENKTQGGDKRCLNV